MKVFILTSVSEESFVCGVANQYDGDFTIVHELHGYPEDYDVGISFMWTKKIPKSELDKTWVNFHPAPLPEYKGRNLCYHAIMNGEKSFGATVHYMDENFDTGCIIDRLDFLIKESWTAQDLHNRVMEASKRLFKRFFPMILTGRRFGCTANEGGTYYKQHPIPEFLQRFDDYTAKEIRAITYGDFYPKIDIGGVTYKIVRDE